MTQVFLILQIPNPRLQLGLGRQAGPGDGFDDLDAGYDFRNQQKPVFSLAVVGRILPLVLSNFRRKMIILFLRLLLLTGSGHHWNLAFQRNSIMSALKCGVALKGCLAVQTHR